MMSDNHSFLSSTKNGVATEPLWQRLLTLIIPPPLSTIDNTLNTSMVLLQGRERILTALLRVTSLFIVIGLAWVFYDNILAKERWDIIIAYLVLAGFIWIFSIFRTINLMLRSVIFLGVIYVAGVIDIVNFGIAEDWRLYFTIFSALATLFLGWRSGFAAVLLSVATFTYVAWQISVGTIVITLSAMASPVPSLENIITFSLMFLMLNSGFVAALAALVREFEVAWQRERQATALVQQERDMLEQRVDERTHELLERNEELALSQQTAVAAKEAAEIANQAKSGFLSSMSHELRTPLNGILGYAQILQRQQTFDSKSTHSAVQVIQQSGQHLLTLINDILDLAKIEAQKLTLEAHVVQLAPFLRGVADLIQARAASKNIAFVTVFDPMLPPAIWVDETRLRQILLNLLDNAVKFTEAGTVTLTVTSDSSPANNGLRFAIADTGVGIAEGELARIFRPFEQVGNGHNRAKGTGLGLAISQQLVQAMGSTLQVASRPGVGSQFWFELASPLAIQPDLLATAVSPTQQIIGYAGERRRILVADDTTHNRTLLSTLLTELGFEVETAVDGPDTVAVASTSAPAALLLDMVMPGYGGLEAAAQLRQQPALRQMVIIAVSADVSEQSQQRAVMAGCDAFLPKPLDIALLLETLARLLGLTWLYAAAPETAVSHPAAPAPRPNAAELAKLHGLALRGDLTAVSQQVQALAVQDEQLAPFAQEIILLVNQFEEEKLIALLNHTTI